MALWTLHAGYDPEARVWYTLECDVPGLVTEGETLERLRDRAAAVLPELIADNAHLVEPDRRAGPHSLRLVAFHESTVPIAADGQQLWPQAEANPLRSWLPLRAARQGRSRDLV